MDLPQEYATNDLYLASYLKARGLKLAAVEKDGRRSRFIFQDAPERRKLMMDYINDVPLGVSGFVHALRDLKMAIHSGDGAPSERRARV